MQQILKISSIIPKMVRIEDLKLRAISMGVVKKGCQILFCNPEQFFGTYEQCFCFNDMCQNGVPF